MCSDPRNRGAGRPISAGMTPDQHLITEPQLDAYGLYVALWLLGLDIGSDTSLTLPGWLSERATTILVLYKPFAQA